MSLETETILERRRLKRNLSFWRVLAVVALVLAIGAIFMAGETGITERRQIARVSLEGMITESREQLRLLERIGEASYVSGVVIYINSPGGTTTGGEAEAVRWLEGRGVQKGLKVIDWKPGRSVDWPLGGALAYLFLQTFGELSGELATLMNRDRPFGAFGLDGLVSVWQPSGN